MNKTVKKNRYLSKSALAKYNGAALEVIDYYKINDSHYYYLDTGMIYIYPYFDGISSLYKTYPNIVPFIAFEICIFRNIPDEYCWWLLRKINDIHKKIQKKN